MERKLLALLVLICIVLPMSIIVSIGAQSQHTAESQSEEVSNIRIGKVAFISRYGQILHSIRKGQEFNILVIIESLEELRSWEWEPFWLEIRLDEVLLGNWGTGTYKGNFVVYSLTHVSVVFDEPGEHFFRISLFTREGDQKGDLLIEEQTVSFTVIGPRR
jgi:hypothetical protein